MSGGSFTARLARAASLRPRATIGAWVAVIVIAVAMIPLLLPSALETKFTPTNNPESERAQSLIDERLPGRSSVGVVLIVRSDTLTADSPEFRRTVGELARKVRGSDGVAGVTTAYTTQDPSLISADRHATLIRVRMTGSESDAESNVGDITDLVQDVGKTGPVEAFITGEPATGYDVQKLSQHDLKKGEIGFGAPAALVILLLVFGAVIAAFVPIALAVVSIVIAIAIVALIGQATPFAIFVVNMITGMGLALGIDYSLFVLSRYREERALGREKLQAIEAAGATASRAVLFSGSAYVIALLGMLLTPLSVLRSLAAGAIVVGIIAIFAALTLLPAILSLLGDRVNSLRVPYFGRSVGQAQEARFWSWAAHAVMRRAVLALVIVTALLIAAAVPIFDLHIGRGGVTTLPNNYPSKQGFLVLQSEFPRATAAPVDVAVDGDVAAPATRSAVDRLAGTLAATPPFRRPQVQVEPARRFALLTVPLVADPDGSVAARAVRRLRHEVIPRTFAGTDAQVLVGGTTAQNVDYFDTTTTWLPRVVAIVLALSFVLLTIAFRSIVVPLKAIVLNLLSVGAAYGLLVLVFQKGFATGLLGFQQVDSIEAWVPLFLFSVLFGLSMDYHVFLLSRIRERFADTGDNSEAVAYGVGSTARLITGAALIIIAVFTGFAVGDLVMFQQMGFGVGVALLLDATIVRSVLVPASMHLLGRRNWYLPRWLTWIPDVSVEGPVTGRRLEAQ